ncbi:MAG: RNA 2',3'-cyclic phosphodiesterase [Nanoarchaeota archaeon]
MRAFIAIDLPQEMHPALQQIQEQIKAFGSFSFPRSFHLTLFFLGEISEQQKEDVVKKLSTARFSPFSFTLSEIGFFDKRVVWAGIRPEEETIKLQKAICSALGMRDDRFHPHITLARIKQAKPGLKEACEEMRLPSEEIRIEKFTLYKSTLLADGPRYETIASFEGFK